MQGFLATRHVLYVSVNNFVTWICNFSSYWNISSRILYMTSEWSKDRCVDLVAEEGDNRNFTQINHHKRRLCSM